jgi:hypothetical protein
MGISVILMLLITVHDILLTLYSFASVLASGKLSQTQTSAYMRQNFGNSTPVTVNNQAFKD